MKIAVISDIHQSVYWRKIIEQVDGFDKIIFLGDEFDTWRNKWPAQMDNAHHIITFKKTNMEKVDLCWSNHAISYYLDEQCSGYQREHAMDIIDFYRANSELYNVVYRYDDWIFSHAGVSAKWMKNCGITDVNEINGLFRERPGFFTWVGPDPYGNNSNEGPLWIRPPALVNNWVKDYNQIAGHTENILPRIIKKHSLQFIFCDTPGHNFLTVLDTYSSTADFVNLK